MLKVMSKLIGIEPSESSSQYLNELITLRSTMVSILASGHSVPKKFSEEKLSMLLRLINGAG